MPKVIIFLLILLCASCSSLNSNMSNNFIDIDSESYQKNINLFKVEVDNAIKIDVNTKINDDDVLLYSSIIDSMHYISLDNKNPNSMIGKVSKLIINNDMLYILDTKKAKRLNVFYRDGTYFTTVGTKGNRFIIYSNQSKKQYGGSVCADDVTGITGAFDILASEGNTLIGAQEANNLHGKIEYANNQNKKRDNSKWVELSKRITPNDNPIIVFYKLKNNL